MTPAEKHVTSLELSKELKKRGYPQEGSLFYWQCFIDFNEQIKWNLVYWRYVPTEDVGGLKTDEYNAAPTAGELGEWLPYGTMSYKLRDGQWMCQYSYAKAGVHGWLKRTEADCRAAMGIQMHDKGIINFSREPKTGDKT